jgi:hypothetical protein
MRARSKDNGYAWKGDGNVDAIGGLTGGSTYQDYTISSISAKRQVVVYASVPQMLFPELIYTIQFKRSQSFYAIQLVVPGCLLTGLSFIAFWVNPEVTDRLGFGVTIILAMITNQITATNYMPVCEEKVLMDYMSIAFLIFGALSLLETGVILYLYQLKCDTWAEALVPRWCRRLASGASWESIVAVRQKRERKIYDNQSEEEYQQYQLRRQLYRQIFYAIDTDFSDSLGLDEIDEFGHFIQGTRWNAEQAKEFLYRVDDNWDGVLDNEEFAFFCEEALCAEYREDPTVLRQMVQGFLIVLDKKMEATSLKWKNRAMQLDQFCRWAIPPGFIFFFILIMALSEEKLNEISEQKGSQSVLILSGLFPIIFIVLAYGVCISAQPPYQRRSFPLETHESFSISRGTTTKAPLMPLTRKRDRA